MSDVSQQSVQQARAHRVWVRGGGLALARRLGPVVPVVLIGLAGWTLSQQLQGLRYADVLGYLSTVPVVALLAALAGTLASYAALIGYDVLALRHVGPRPPYRRVAAASLVGFGISNTVGQVWLTGGAARYRMYRAAGLSGSDIASVVVFVSLAFWLGYVVLAALLFPFTPPPVPGSVRLGIPLPALGWICLALLVAYLAWCWAGQGARRLRPPTVRLALAQVVLAAVRTMLTAGVLYALLAATPVRYVDVLGVFVLAVGAASLGQVPAAAGVLEATVVLSLSSAAPMAWLVGALVLFRLLYYLIPLAAAVAGLAVSEARRKTPR